MSKIFYDIIPPKADNRKIVRKKKPHTFQPGFGIIKTSIVKIVVFLVIVSLNWTGFSAVLETFAYLNDRENSSTNSFSASTLDFSLSPADGFSPNVTPAQPSSRTITLTKNEGLGFQYELSAVNFSNSALCDDLDLEANLHGGSPEYAGDLVGFYYNAGQFSDPDDWIFTITLPSNDPGLQNQTCTFDFLFSGSQIGGAGFSDQETISNTITSGIWLKVVINKVYYDVDDDHGIGSGANEWKNEWIELYNPTDKDINLKKWEICNHDDCEILDPQKTIPAFGFALLSHDNNTWQYWEVPAEIETINQPGGQFEMDNDADMLILKNAGGTIIDQMNWGTPASAWPNYNEDVWDQGVPDAPEGHILARVPTGLDTDTPADWKDLGLPQVTVIYPTDGVWYCNAIYNLKWTATNPNGDNNELTIDIIYITDNDSNGIISPGDHTYLIADNISNTGSYDWKIDFFKGYCYYGYVWIKVVAIGPENFMVNNFGISNRVFEPPDSDLLDLQEVCSSIDEYCGGSEEIYLAMEEFCAAAQIYFPEAFEVHKNIEEMTFKEEASITEEVIVENQTEEEISSEEKLIVPEEENETAGETIVEITEETTIATTEEPVSESNDSVSQETPVNEETPINEAPVDGSAENSQNPEIQQTDNGASAQETGEQPTVAPNDSPQKEGVEESLSE